jgi:3-oxoacyl-[acyl-carrier protein] reductase
MDLKLRDKNFVVTGATSGFGKAIVDALLEEGAHIIMNARGEDKLLEYKKSYPKQIEILVGDITTDFTISKLKRALKDKYLHGFVINAGGPPASSFLHTEMDAWDKAYANVLRWKVKLTQEILPIFIEQNYGRLLYIESASVKQPIENLVLSNSLRMAVVGFVKTLSTEVASKGISCNILAPGYHDTPAMERLFINKSSLLGISPEEARVEFEKEILSGKLGDAEDLASIAVWLLSERANYITGQTISLDGGLVKSSFG